MKEGYRNLDIYNLAHQLALQIHKMTLSLPKFEMYEEGSQIRRSAKSVSSQIVEGYCLRKNKNEFLQYLTRTHATCEETIEHLDYLFETGSLKDQMLFEHLRNEYLTLSKQIFRFTQGVYSQHDKPNYLKEPSENVPSLNNDVNFNPES